MAVASASALVGGLAELAAAASQSPQKGCSAVCIRMINLPAVAALRGTTDGTYAGSAAGTSAECFRSQAISRSRKIRCGKQLTFGFRCVAC